MDNKPENYYRVFAPRVPNVHVLSERLAEARNPDGVSRRDGADRENERIGEGEVGLSASYPHGWFLGYETKAASKRQPCLHHPRYRAKSGDGGRGRNSSRPINLKKQQEINTKHINELGSDPIHRIF